jgi:hypothetical protein
MQTNLHLILHESLERANERLDFKNITKKKSHLVIPMLPAAVCFRIAVPSKNINNCHQQMILLVRENSGTSHSVERNVQVVEDEGFASQRRRLLDKGTS